MDGQTLTAYTISEAAEILDVTPGTLRNWEKNFSDNLKIPRYETGPNSGDRYYTEIELETLRFIKNERDKNKSIAMINEDLERKPNTALVEQQQVPLNQLEITRSLRELQNTLETLPEAKEKFIESVRSDLRDEVRQEVQETVRNEIRSEFEELKKQLIEEQKEKDKKKGFFSRLFGS